MRKIQTTSANGKYSERGMQLLAENTKKMVQEKMEYGVNYVTIEAESLNSKDKKGTIKKYKVRINDVYSDVNTTKRKDGYKIVVWQSPKINYIPEGLKLWFYGSTWIVDNPANLTKVVGQANARQCVASRKTLDYYGNIIEEPFAIDRELTSTNGYNTSKIDIVSGNLSCLMQYNDNTKNIKNNDRILMGGQAFQIVGLDNYTREFGNDENSIKKLKFDLQIVEPTNNDDIENNIVDGKVQSWKIYPNVDKIETRVASKSVLSATATRNGETPEKNYDIEFESTNSSVITIDRISGEYEAKSVGKSKVKCYLKQNPNIYEYVDVNIIKNDVYEVRFDNIVDAIPQYTTTRVTAYLYKNGVKQNNAVEFYTNGANGYYSIYERSDNYIDITCAWANDMEPLELKAKVIVDGEEYEIAQQIWLETL